MSSECLVSFIVLNWNGLNDTLICLDSIREQTFKSYEIIVVDNGSSDDQKQHLKSIVDITLIDLPINTGFTGGQLAAAKIARGEFLALINNDAVLDKHWAEKAIETFQKHPNAAAIGGKAFKWDNTKKNEVLDETNEFYSYQVVNPSTGHTKTLTYGEDVCEVNSISGAGVAIRKSVIDEVGYFDDRFFAYYEETDLFARFKRAGYSIIYNPDLHIWHKIAQSSGPKPNFYLYQMHRNRFIFAVKNFDKPYLRRFIGAYCRETIRAILRILRHGNKNSKEELYQIKAFTWNLTHLLPTMKYRKNIVSNNSYIKTLGQDKTESVTVVIPCYNYEKYVVEAIESVLEQTRPADEIIVINDGSSDDSLKVINKFKNQVKIIDQKNHGVIYTKNVGIKEATSEWLLFLDADDKLDKIYISKLLSAAILNNANIAYSGMKFFGSETGIFESRSFTTRSLKKGNYINNSALMRRQLLVDRGYSPSMQFGFEDWELYISLAEKGAKFWYVSLPLLFYRRHSTDSRDIKAKRQLDLAKQTIKQLHPKIFSFRRQVSDYIYTLLTFHQRRGPIKILKDMRYGTINRLDRAGLSFRPLNQSIGFFRLLKAGKFKLIVSKFKLNLRRLWQKITG